VLTVVADSHALVWHLTAPSRLGRGARRAFAASDEGRWLCYVPIIVLVEIALLQERGRLQLSPGEIVDAVDAHAGYAILPLDTPQAIAFVETPGVRDPMDRLILAAARATSSRVLSRDPALDGHGIERIWD
jgi:PIN domain nuclease of toxin-antitoxin system